MAIRDLFKSKKYNKREDEGQAETTVGSDLLKALLENGRIDRQKAMGIPAVASCVNLIANTVSMLPIRLYERAGELEVNEIKGDRRIYLLNEDTEDTLNGVEFKRAMVTDYLLGKGGYAYINRSADFKTPISIHYVKENELSFLEGTDPIFKNFVILIQGRRYRGEDFIKLLRNTRNGWRGTPIIEEIQELLGAAYYSQQMQTTQAQTGGNKKGFVRSTRHLSETALGELKSAWRKMYSTGSENVVILNDGLEFKESSSTNVELQLNESIEAMAKSICQVFGVPVGMFAEKPSEEARTQFVQNCIVPIISEFECALNSVLLTEAEKENRFFSIDTRELTKGDVLKRYQAYEIALKNSWLQVDEIRADENRKSLGLNLVKTGLQDVWFDPETGNFYNPNMNIVGGFEESSNGGIEGGENGGRSGNQE